MRLIFGISPNFVSRLNSAFFFLGLALKQLFQGDNKVVRFQVYHPGKCSDSISTEINMYMIDNDNGEWVTVCNKRISYQGRPIPQQLSESVDRVKAFSDILTTPPAAANCGVKSQER
ncbi:hypothetical protein ACTVOV_10075 [Serratia marcescens]|uniref:hypothetical protein n=1 Tax=Serratia marcescens TaxID=615 RepID=UPI003FA76016